MLGNKSLNERCEMIDKIEFFQWAFDDVMDNATRAILGEYIVHKAISSDTMSRENWVAYDLKYKDIKIEVKTSGYVQTWHKTDSKASRISFDIGSKSIWDETTNSRTTEKTRYADIWVFCIHNEKDVTLANPLDENQWSFLVCSTVWLNEKFPNYKSISLSSLQDKGLENVKFTYLQKTIDNIMGTLNENKF